MKFNKEWDFLIDFSNTVFQEFHSKSAAAKKQSKATTGIPEGSLTMKTRPETAERPDLINLSNVLL